ncbi:MAG: hypothetical protein ACI861_002376 [Paracoccaceae bacterium]|jgi:hypothetical protein
MARELPTSGKLVAGICFAALGYVSASTYALNLPEAWRISWFLETSAALGFLVGWLVMGRLVGVSLRSAAGRGLTTAIWLLFWTLLSFSIHEMLMRSLDKRYLMPMDAVGGAVEIWIFLAKLTLNAEFLSTLLIGGLISGVLAELANRFWR